MQYHTILWHTSCRKTIESLQRLLVKLLLSALLAQSVQNQLLVSVHSTRELVLSKCLVVGVSHQNRSRSVKVPLLAIDSLLEVRNVRAVVDNDRFEARNCKRR